MDASTSGNYESHLRQFWRYAAMLGDYESMLMLLKKPPLHCPSMSVRTIESFLRFKRLHPNEPLLDIVDNPILDVFNTPMTADGSWNAPKNVDIYRAAVHDIHIANGHTVAYEEACSDCRAVPEATRHQGCEHHLGHPRLYRCGDPTRHIEFTNTMMEMDNLAKAAGYKEKGSSQLLPSDLRLLRSYLLSTQDILDLQMWVINIVATKVGMRHDEFHGLNAEHFLPQYFEITDDRIDALAITVNGKADNEWVPLKLHADHVYPDLCPVRPLLVYIHLLGIKGGYLFPTASEVKNPPTDGVYKTTVCYGQFLQQFKKLCLAVLPARPDFKIGAQVFRKTFYCLAIFGEAPEYDLKESARHKSVECSLVYRKASQVLYNQHRNNPHPSNNVSKWKATKIDGSDGNTTVLLALSGCKIMQFSELGDFFVRKLLQVAADNPLAKDFRFLMDRAINYIGAESPRERFNKFRETLHPDQGDELQRIFDAMLCERLKALLENNGLATATAGMVLPETAVLESPQEPPSKRARVEEPKNDLTGRELLRRMTSAAEKIHMMRKLNTEKNQTPLTSGAKTFVSKHLNPVMNCLTKHFGGDDANFLAKYPAFNHTTFADNFCNGQGDVCARAPSPAK
jgi:hypothetical protein